MKNYLIAIMTLFLLLLVSCSNGEMVLDNEQKDIKQLVNQYSIGNIDGNTASITSEFLLVSDKNGNTKSYKLPEDEFFISIAPYINQTHPCENHSLTGCQGEMANESFHLIIKDSSDNVLWDNTVESFDNGFIDLWLPRNDTYKVKIEHDGKVVESEISTFKEDGTCITTMQLI